MECQSWVTGFKLRQEAVVNGDNTALNGIQLKCMDGATTGTIDGYWGDWDEKWVMCPKGSVIEKFAVKGMPDGKSNQGVF